MITKRSSENKIKYMKMYFAVGQAGRKSTIGTKSTKSRKKWHI